MFKETPAFSSFSINDLASAKRFYTETLGLNATEEEEGLSITLADGGAIFLYPKPNHSPASFTVLNFLVANLEQAVEALTEKGLRFEHYSGDIQTDEKGIFRGRAKGKGPDIAWFKDPAGNILSVVQEK
jgi:catechol 2,3-dioxygenase-like lactoylglutathione lyase family enzyme